MTRSDIRDPKLWILGALLIVEAFSYGLSSPRSASAAAGELPPSLVKGARITGYIPAMMRHQEFMVEDVRGNWVLGTVVDIGGWKTGARVWINLTTIQSMAVSAPTSAAPPK